MEGAIEGVAVMLCAVDTSRVSVIKQGKGWFSCRCRRTMDDDAVEKPSMLWLCTLQL
jgi:hypothetical protein